MTVAELEHRMSLQEMRRWREFFIVEPTPVERIDLAGALITSTLANINRQRNAKPFTLQDFMLVERTLRAMEVSEPSEDREALHLMSTILALGGTIQ
jgi:hypothetical protein